MLDGGELGVSEASNGTRTDYQPGDRQLGKHNALNGMWLDCHPGGCVYTAHGASNGTQLDHLPGGREPGLGRAHKPIKGQRRRLSMGRTSDKDSHDDAKDSVARGGGGDDLDITSYTSTETSLYSVAGDHPVKLARPASIRVETGNTYMITSSE